VVSQGRRYRLGRTDSYGGIWRKRPWGWRMVARYPLTDEGWHAAQGQFAMWEPTATAPAAGTVGRSHGSWLTWGVPAIVLAVILAGTGIYFGHVVTFKSPPASSSPQSPNAAAAPTTTRPPVGTGYLATGRSTVIFIQWNDVNGTLSGTAQDVALTGTAPTLHLSSSSLRVSGELTGSRITLSFDGGVQEFGTLSSGSFTVNFPQSDGTLAPVTFTTATTAAYNQAVEKLRAEVAADNTAARNAEARAKTETGIYQDAKAVLGEIGTLQTQTTQLPKTVAGVSTSLSGEATGLAQTQSALSTVHSCVDASEVGVDANEVAVDANQVSISANQVKRAIGSIQSEISTLDTSLTALNQAETNFPGYTPPNQPAPTSAAQAIAAANGAVASAITTTNGYIGQANADVSTAQGVAAQALRNASCSGGGANSFTPIPAIT